MVTQPLTTGAYFVEAMAGVVPAGRDLAITDAAVVVLTVFAGVVLSCQLTG